MNIFRAVFGAALLAASASNAFAQCEQILQHGIWQSRDTSSSMAMRSDVANWACSESGSSNSLGGKVPGGPSLNASSSSSSKACQSLSNSYALSQEAQEKVRLASIAIVGAWEKCVSQPGAHASLLFMPDNRQFAIYLRYQDSRSLSTTARIQTLQSIACTMDRPTMESGITVQGEVVINCTRSSPEEAISLAINFPGITGKSLFLPAVIPGREQGPPSIAETMRQLIGEYQVNLGPKGGCNGGRPGSAPSQPARVVPDGAGLKAINECGQPSPMQVLSPDRVFFFGLEVPIAWSAYGLWLNHGGNVWSKK